MSPHTRRTLLAGAAGLAASAFAPAGLRLSTSSADPRAALWRREGGPHLRGAVFVQRRVYPDLDGPTFLGPGPVGSPITDAALASLAQAGANLASWSGPGPFAEGAPFGVDQAIVDHMGAWLDRCQAHGLFTVLCLRSGPGRSAFAFHQGETWYPRRLYNDSLWREPEKQDAWAQMVRWTINTFSGHSALAGVLAMDEPNGADLGVPEVWPDMAARIARDNPPAYGRAPLLLSPDRWARLEEADTLRRKAGMRAVLVTHDYAPWTYTHQDHDSPQGFTAAQTSPPPPRALGAAAVLEFGAPRGVRDLTRYLRHRIDAYEAAGVNWAVFRWTSGWRDYEAVEGRRALNEDPGAAALLRQAFAGAQVRPDAP